ncbi:MAG TPA: sucrase ferredoxin [Acidimicrobiales bacterium]|nr:sucrase ferredoxin [Acidimicrobiales bacterium]
MDTAEELEGTASRIRSWLVVEQPGPWGADAVPSSRLARDVGRELTSRCRPLDVRLVLIRRPTAGPVGTRAVFVAHSDPSRPQLHRADLHDERDLLDIDVGALARGDLSGVGRPHPEPVYLVCTNGKRDVCCAINGRPLVRALSALEPERTWECTHIGGDRFAANMVVLPKGLYFGRVAPEDVDDLAARLRDEKLLLPRYRGRSWYDRASQFAEISVRRRFGVEDQDGIGIEWRKTNSGDGAVRVGVRLPDRGVEVVELRRRVHPPRPLTCSSTAPAAPWTFDEVDEVDEADDSGDVQRR